MKSYERAGLFSAGITVAALVLSSCQSEDMPRHEVSAVVSSGASLPEYPSKTITIYAPTPTMSSELPTVPTLAPTVTSPTSVLPNPSGSTKQVPNANTPQHIASKPSISDHLVPCYDTAQPYPKAPSFPIESQFKNTDDYLAATRKYVADSATYLQSNSPITLNYNKTSNNIVGDPLNLPKAVDAQVSGSIVEIRSEIDGKWFSGSGFVTEISGRRVVVTAQHVIKGTPLHNIFIDDNMNHEVTPIGGCDIFESSNKKHPALNSEVVQDHDIAVLEIPQNTLLGTSSLTIATNDAPRGEWVTYKNFQNNRLPGNPATYNGIIAASTNTLMGYTALTGLEPFTKTIEAETNVPGCSGGVVVNRSGEVIGVSYSGHSDSNNNPIPDTPSFLHNLFNITIDRPTAQPIANLAPNESGLQTTGIILSALRSPRA